MFQINIREPSLQNTPAILGKIILIAGNSHRSQALSHVSNFTDVVSFSSVISLNGLSFPVFRSGFNKTGTYTSPHPSLARRPQAPFYIFSVFD